MWKRIIPNLVHYAAFKNHIGFYPVPSGIEAFKEELKIYKQGKGSVPTRQTVAKGNNKQNRKIQNWRKYKKGQQLFWKGNDRV